MDWKSFFIGIGLLIGGFLLYKFRNFGNDESGYEYDSAKRLKTWILIVAFGVMGVVYIIQSLP
jgi:hypothetical protein